MITSLRVSQNPIVTRVSRQFKYQRAAKHENIIPGISQELKTDGNLCVEYIFTKPKWHHFFKMLFSDSHSTHNPYGHSAIRYVDPDTGEDTVMNVCGLKDHKLINFIPAAEYLFTENPHPGNEQRGVFHRSFIGLRIENVSRSQVRTLVQHYKSLEQKNANGKVAFFLMPVPLLNFFRWMLGKSEIGNCSYWTSQGLKKARIIPRGTSFPLLLFFLMLKQHMASDFADVNIVSYLGLHHPAEPRGSFIYPLYWLKRGYEKIWNLDELSNLIFELQDVEQKYPGKSYPLQSPHCKLVASQPEVDGASGWRLLTQRHISHRIEEVRDKLNNIFKR